MRLKHQLRHALHRLGVDMVRYPLHDPLARTAKLLRHYDIDCVIDVGANDGGFATGIRGLGYKGRIASFEPLDGPFEQLSRRAATDDGWSVRQCALGDSTDEITISISGDSGLSSSALNMLQRHVDAAPNSRPVATQAVRQDRLDRLFPELAVDPSSRVFLKVDVEGYEGRVLDGAAELFAAGRITGLQLELSLVPLYEAAMTYREGFDRAEALGMKLMGLDPVFVDENSGQLLQVDAVFFAG